MIISLIDNSEYASPLKKELLRLKRKQRNEQLREDLKKLRQDRVRERKKAPITKCFRHDNQGQSIALTMM